MSRYKAYPEYKDSGVEWLDKVPLHWISVPIKYMALEKTSLFLDGDWIESKDISGDEIRYITTGNVGEGAYKEQGVGFISTEKFFELNCTEVFSGDILMSRLNAPIGRSCIVPDLQSRVVTSVDNVIFRPDSKYIKAFLVYLFSSGDYFAHTANLARGATMQRISRGLLGNVRVVVPSLVEQQKIANFLDHETAKIDTLIAKQQELIKLLKEKRQAVISHAVTKGLNPNAPMRDSGVEWLGEVPAHWICKSYRHACNIYRGKFGHRPRNDPAFYDGVYPFIQTGDVAQARKYITEYKQTLNERGRSVSQLFPIGTLVMTIAANIGDTAILSFEAYAPDSIVGFKPREDLDLEFLRYSLMGALPALVQTSTQSTQANLNIERVGSVQAAFPSKEEQLTIVRFIDETLERYDRIEERANIGVELLMERRTALISAAVTGKIDVRDWQSPSDAAIAA